MADTPTGGEAAAAPTLSKTEAVKRSLRKLGNSAKPLALSKDIKARFGLDVAADYAGKIKAELLRGSAKPEPKPAAPAKAQAAASNGKAPSVSFDDIFAVKSLVERVGAENLRTLIGAFEK